MNYLTFDALEVFFNQVAEFYEIDGHYHSKTTGDRLWSPSSLMREFTFAKYADIPPAVLNKAAQDGEQLASELGAFFSGVEQSITETRKMAFKGISEHFKGNIYIGAELPVANERNMGYVDFLLFDPKTKTFNIIELKSRSIIESKKSKYTPVWLQARIYAEALSNELLKNNFEDYKVNYHILIFNKKTEEFFLKSNNQLTKAEVAEHTRLIRLLNNYKTIYSTLDKEFAKWN